MNAVLTHERGLHSQAVTQSREMEGEVIAAWPIAPGALLVLGWQTGWMADDGVAQLDRDAGRRGPYRAISWEAEDHLAGLKRPGTRLFLAALRLPASLPITPGRSLLMVPGGAGEAMAVPLPERFADGQALAAAITTLAGRHGATCLRFLLETLTPSAMRRVPEARSMVETLVMAFAEPDGCVELLGSCGESGAFLQGWAGETADGAQVILVGETIGTYSAIFGRFDREDVVAPSRGVLMLVSGMAEAELASLRHVVVLDGMRLCRREVIDARVILPEAACAPHLAAMLPRLSGGADLLACLRAATRARFDGRDTMNAAGSPVRAAVDVALTVPGGIYLHGWLYDPAARLAELFVRGAGEAARVDACWTRIPRPDVAQAYAGDAALPAGDAARDRHGFAAFVTLAEAPSQALCLEARLADGTLAFLPLQAREAASGDGVARMLGSADLYKPSGLAVVERQLAPAFGRLAAVRPAVTGRVVVRVPDAARMDLAIVVPLADDSSLPASFLSQFMLDPLGQDERLVFVCGAAWEDAAIARLRQVLSLRGLAAWIIVADAPMRATLAADLAASLIPGDASLLLADPALHGMAPGWRQALRAASTGRDCVSPTLLYEDGSVRFAGVTAVEGLDSAPYVKVGRGLAGLPASLVPPSGETVPVLAASLACCLFTREAVRRGGGAARIWPGSVGEELDWFLRLRGAGVQPHWLPGVRVHATGAPVMAASEVARLSDGLVLRGRWGGSEWSASQGEVA